MNRGVDRQAVFFADEDRYEFERRLAEMRQRFGVATLAYCLMGNHFHLLLHSPPGTLSAAMHHCLAVYARHTNDRVGRDGPLFRGRFLGLAVESECYLLAAARYVHRNPIDVDDRPIADYRWSSYGAYLGRRRVPSFVDPAPLMGLFAGDRTALARHTEGRPDLLTGHRITSDDLRSLVMGALAVEMGRGRVGDASAQAFERASAALLADHPHPVVREAAEKILGPVGPDALRKARRRARSRYATDPVLRSVLAAVTGLLESPRAA